MPFLSSLAAKAKKGKHNDFNAFRCPVKEYCPRRAPHEGKRGHPEPCPQRRRRAGVRSVPVPGLVWDSSGRTRQHRLGPRPASSGAAIVHCDGVSQD